MTAQEVIAHFGSIRKTSEAVGISFQSVHLWLQKEKVPQGRQWQIQALTGGRLVVDRELHERTAS